MKLPPIASPPAALSLECPQATARRPGGKGLLRQQRTQLREIRDAYEAHAQEQLATHDELLARFDTAIDGEIEA